MNQQLKFALFYHSVISDWNHGNAHFLRGLMRALQARGHSTICYEPVDSWSLLNLLEVNPNAIEDFRKDFPDLSFERYSSGLDLQECIRAHLSRADVAIVHEWNEPEVVRLVGRLARELDIPAYFHDTHYRV